MTEWTMPSWTKSGNGSSPVSYTHLDVYKRQDLESGESYYIVEIGALKRILDVTAVKTPPVLCFVDEVLRGTNTVERIAASTQILKSLSRENVTCFAATHDIELTRLLQEEYDNYHFEEQVEMCIRDRSSKGKAVAGWR